MTLSRLKAASPLALAAFVVLWAACGPGDQERWAALDVPAPEIVFLGDFTEEERAAITREVKKVQVSYAERFGVVTSEFTLYISTEFEPLNEAYREWLHPVRQRQGEELPSWLNCNGFAERAAIFTSIETCRDDERAYGGLIAHEYFHVLQEHVGLVGVVGSSAYGWMIEGAAEYASAHYEEEQGRRTVSWRREVARLQWSALPGCLPDLCGAVQSIASGQIGVTNAPLLYDVGFLAVDWLVEEKGEEALIEFFRLGGGRREFEEAFGMTRQQFAEAFGLYGLEVAAPFERRTTGAVRDPDGRRVPRVYVDVLMEVDGERVVVSGSATGATGRFGVLTPEERHTLAVFLQCPRGSRTHWAFAGEWGENGYVADDDGQREPDGRQAEPMTGMDRPVIVIELQASRAVLLERFCEKR